jgi:hypothetical protein
MKSVHLEVTMIRRIGELNKENARLKAEVERLTKAGDDLYAEVGIHSRHHNCGSRDEWLRAKKGLPSLKEQYEKQKVQGWDFVRPPMPNAAKEGKPSA